MPDDLSNSESSPEVAPITPPPSDQNAEFDIDSELATNSEIDSTDDPVTEGVRPAQRIYDRNRATRRRIFFNPDALPPTYPAYVAWLDVMGSKSAMSQSLARSAHYIGRLHVAILMNRSRKPDLQTSPFMDGAYIRSSYQSSMLNFLWGMFDEIAFDFLTAARHEHRFMPRCGLSYGHIVQGINIPSNVSIILGAYSNRVYREGIYLGYPMVQANIAEADAPPFGVAIHESARAFSSVEDRPLSGLWWRWHVYRRPDFFDEFTSILKSYFDWCYSHSNSMGYSRDRIVHHRNLAFEYFDIG